MPSLGNACDVLSTRVRARQPSSAPGSSLLFCFSLAAEIAVCVVRRRRTEKVFLLTAAAAPEEEGLRPCETGDDFMRTCRLLRVSPRWVKGGACTVAPHLLLYVHLFACVLSTLAALLPLDKISLSRVDVQTFRILVCDWAVVISR